MKRFVTRVLYVLLTFGLGACSAAVPRPSFTPVLGAYTSEQWGRCAVVGVQIGRQVGAVVTAHGCVRSILPDGGVMLDASADAAVSE